MGIKDINKTIGKYAPKACRNIPCSEFKGSTIGIDGYAWMHIAAHGIQKGLLNKMADPLEKMNKAELFNGLMDRCLGDIAKLLYLGIEPAFFWDRTPGEEKMKTLKKRRDQKEKSREKLRELKEAILETDILDRTPDMIADYKKSIANFKMVGSEEANAIHDILISYGFNSYKSPEGKESEKIAACAAIEGSLSAVWSNDTDLLALACPIWIKGFGPYEKGQPTFECVGIHDVLDGLTQAFGFPVTQSMFVDICIMHGTDFNERKPRVGPETIVKLIKQNKTIDMLPEAYQEVYDQKFVRTIFAYEKSGIDIPRLNKEKILAVVREYSGIPAVGKLIASLIKYQPVAAAAVPDFDLE